VYQNFQRNLNDIVKVGLNSGAKILLNTVAVNLKDCPPFASMTNASLSMAARAQFDQLLSEANADEVQSNFAGAAQKYEQAAKMDPLFSEVPYRWGGCLLALTNFAGARAQFQTACDLDALPFRADSRINGAIQKTGKQFAGDRLTLFDAAAALGKNLPAGVCGQETFFEHVHFTFDGNYQLGQAWAEQVEKMLPSDITRAAGTNGWASQETCDRLLGLTDWNRHAVTQVMIGRLQQPPLSDQPNNAARIQRLHAEENNLRQRMNPAAAQQASEVYQSAIRRSPPDHTLRENFAEFLEAIHDEKQAAAQWRQEQQLVPHDWEPFFQAGRLLAELGQWDEAQLDLTKAVTLRPRLAEGWSELGGIQLATGKFEPAYEDYSLAQELDPQNAAYRAEVGGALSKLNRHAEAIEQYRRAIQMQPDLWEAHFALAGELVAVNQLAEAKNEFGAAARLNPSAARTHFNYGVLLAKQGQLDEAQREFETVLRIEPAYPNVQGYLARVLAMKQRPQ
jgi:tetratricopeptide (TPR) repeat protein